MFTALQDAASKGLCLHKGSLKSPIANSSRAFAADRLAPTELLVIDIDGLELPIKNVTNVKAVAEKIIAQLPEYIQDV